MILWPIERLIVRVTLVLAGLCVALMWVKGIRLGSWEYPVSASCAIGLIVVGQIYRRLGRSEKIALMCHAAGLFLGFSAAGSLYNILLLPLSHAPIDGLLVRIDAWFGYSWPALCAWVAQFPVFAKVLRLVYLTTLPQLLVVILLLGGVEDRQRLHRASLALVIAASITICFWSIFPSLGASSYWRLDARIDAIVRPIVGSDYGQYLRLIVNGRLDDVASMNISGLIGLPSFHTVMALMTLLAIWPYRWLRVFFVLLAALMLPAILVDGGHNLLDVFGGVFVLALSWRIAISVERRIALQESKPHFWARDPENIVGPNVRRSPVSPA